MSAARRHNLVREAGGLAAARVAVRVLGVLVGWVVARMIGPEGLGRLALPNFILVVTPFITLGFVDGLTREMPLARREDPPRELRLVASAWSATLAAVAICLAVVLLWRRPLAAWIGDPLLLWLAVGSGLANAALRVPLLALTGGRRVRELMGLQVLQGVLRASFVLSLIFLVPPAWRVYVLHAGMLASLAACLAWAARLGALAAPRADRDSLGRLARSGPPMALASLFLMLLVVGDRLAMSRVLPPAALGLYEQGVLIRDGLLLLPGVLLSLLIPDYAARQDDPARRPALLADVARQTGLMAVGTPVLLGLAALQLPWLVELALPRFLAGLPLFQLAVLAMCPVFLSYILVSLLISEGRSARVALAAAACLAAVLALDSVAWSPPRAWLEGVLGGAPAAEGMVRALAGALAALGGFWLFTLAVVAGNARRLALPARRVCRWLAPSLLLTLAFLAALGMGWLREWSWSTNLAALAASLTLLAAYERRGGQLSKVWRARRAAKP